MKKNSKTWFTLIELLVSISILSIVMISIFTIFQLASEANNRTDISRAMQENIKNIVETIAEDVRTKSISWLNSQINWSCDLSWWGYLTWSKLCIWGNNYYLARFNNTTWVYNRIIDFSDCDIWKESCVLVKKDVNGDINPLSNSWVEFRNINFSVVNLENKEKKLILNFVMQPSTKKWIKMWLIKDNKIIFQTTFSQRLYNSY